MRIICLSLLALAAGPVLADPDSTPLNPVVVTATRSELALDRLPGSAIVIDRDTIDRQTGTSLAELLRFHAGIQIARSGGPGANTSLFLRGTESNHVLVLVDGIEMNPGSIGGAALQNIPLESIERIEVIKGPRSALYGSEAIGGVVNIITRRSDEDRAFAAATVGSFATRELDAGYLGREGGWHFGAEAGRQESDGFPPLAASDIDRGYERDQLNAFAGWRSERFFVEARHWQSNGVSEYLGFSLEPLSQAFRNETTALDLRYAWSDWSSRLLLGNAGDEIQQRQANFLGEFDRVETDRDTLDWKFDFHGLENHTVTAGFYREDADVVSRSFGSAFEASEDVDAVYVQDVAEFDTDTFVAALRISDYETFDRETTWNAGWNRNTGSTRFFVSAGSAFRAPDATDRFGFGGNPDLQPETSRSIEIGYGIDFSARQSLQLAAFRNDIDQLIAFVDPDGFAGPDPGHNVNVDEARIEGIELVHEWRANNWHWRAEALVQDPKDRNTDAQLARRSEQTLTATLVKTLGELEVGVDALAASDRPDSPFSDVRLPGYGVVSGSVRWFVSPAWSLSARIENLLDREYQTAAGYNSAERSYYVTLRYSQ